jgi:prefoldin subunit 5
MQADVEGEQLRLALEAETEATQQQLQTLMEYQSDYTALERVLLPLPDARVPPSVMVPLTKRGFFPGHLIDTNNLMVLLGENLFVGA